MAANKPTQLSSSLVARKGQAAPATTATAPALILDASATGGETLTPMTVKLDDDRYRRLKNLGMRRPRRSSQVIMVAALDAYLKSEGV